MYILNKIAAAIVNPTVAAALFVLLGYLMRKRLFYILALVWLWFWASTLPLRWFGVPMEGEYPQKLAEEYPASDAIVLLGGGMFGDTNILKYAELQDAGDRAWFAGRLYKAGKAPLVVVTGVGSNESDAEFLRDYGVPESAIAVDDDARNTEENAKFTKKVLEGRGRRVLLVTSAWHMRRAALMFSKYAPSLDVTPAPADYMFTSGGGRPFEAKDLLPCVENFYRSTTLFRELLGYFGYKIFR